MTTHNTEEIRVNKYLSSAGVCSRREADRIVEDGRVTIDDMPATTGMKVRPGQIVKVDGKPVQEQEETVILAVNKPRGVVCTTDRRWGDALLEDLVDYPTRVFNVGRLDKDSEGLILMTNQGDLLNRIMKAGNFHEKEYIVRVDRPYKEAFLKKMAAGVRLEELNRTTRKCKVTAEGPDTFRIVLTQGLNRQIRRMCSALGYEVKDLKRVRIMNVELGDLAPGKWRKLTAREEKDLMKGLEGSVNNTEHKFMQAKKKER